MLYGIVSKSKAAFEFSFEKLVARNNQLYFWTFTPEVKVSDWRFSSYWNRFSRNLFRYCLEVGFEGLRVFERWEDGFLHAHLVCNHRLPVRYVRLLAGNTGIGWMHASPAKARAGSYMAKYLGKQFRDNEHSQHIRQWAALGNWPYTRVGDVETRSHDIDLLRHFMPRYKGERGAFFKAHARVRDVIEGRRSDPLLPRATSLSAQSGRIVPDASGMSEIYMS